ncbi:hypothetical protein ACFY1P_20810 [Streptomyces sp. NPDC001407]|uniref:hypothetical protein n=1 Tax=Streptomyces sp. NPDC001407 TaxID=3364573 RepID=UPI00368E9B3A
MKNPRYTWSPYPCTTCKDPQARFVPEDSDCPNSLLCTRCLHHGHLPYVTLEALKSRVAHGQIVALRGGVLQVATVQGDPVPEGLTAYTRRIADLAESKGLHIIWRSGSSGGCWHRLVLRPHGPHGVRGDMDIGVRSGKVLRAQLLYPDGSSVRWEGAGAVREGLANMPAAVCPPYCAAESPDVCTRVNQC